MSKSLQYQVAARIVSLKDPQESWGDFAARVGLSPQTVSAYRKEANGAGLDAVASVVSRVRNLSSQWLLVGDGPMFAAEPGRELRAFRQIAEIVDEVRASGRPEEIADGEEPRGVARGAGEPNQKAQ